MPKFQIRHITKYTYEVPVRDSANQIMLYPLKDNFQEVLEHNLWITGYPIIEVHSDYFGNEIGTFTHTQPHQELVIDSKLVVVTHAKVLPADTIAVPDQWKALNALRVDANFIDYMKHDFFESMSEVRAVVEDDRYKNVTPLFCARELTQFVYKNFEYKSGITTVETTPEEIWKIKTGVCQDFALILLVMLRQLNIPARYVSGYICANKANMRGEGATHAWVEAYIPFYGWLGFDPTNNCVANEAHVRLAVGRNFSDCSPVKGTYRGVSEHTLEVAVSVSYEDGQTESATNEVIDQPEVITSISRNSFRRHQEMQMQQ